MTSTPTATSTQTPTPENLCVLVTWDKGLNVRPDETMYNSPITGEDGGNAMNISKGSVIPVDRIFYNDEGQWAEINWGMSFAMSLHVKDKPDKIYAIPAACSR
jgi:hypothetical protein